MPIVSSIYVTFYIILMVQSLTTVKGVPLSFNAKMVNILCSIVIAITY